jgi:hypothetical protein
MTGCRHPAFELATKDLLLFKKMPSFWLSLSGSQAMVVILQIRCID